MVVSELDRESVIEIKSFNYNLFMILDGLENAVLFSSDDDDGDDDDDGEEMGPWRDLSR